MDGGLLVRGLALGFAVAAPVGPIGVLVMRRTLAAGPRVGFVSGLGAATADAGYGCVAVLGLSAATRLLVSHADWLRLSGGVFLLWFGIRTLVARPQSGGRAEDTAGGLWPAYGSTLLLTVTNPMTILSFAAAFAGLGLAGAAAGPGAGLPLVAAVFLGSLLWWALLSGAVGLLRGTIGVGTLRAVNWAAGLLLTGFGLAAVTGFRT